MTYELVVERERDGVRSWMPQDSGDGVLPGGGEGAGWGQIMDAKRQRGRHTYWRWRGSGIGSDHGYDCKESRVNIPTGGGEGAGWSQITDATAKTVGMTYALDVEREQDGIR